MFELRKEVFEPIGNQRGTGWTESGKMRMTPFQGKKLEETGQLNNTKRMRAESSASRMDTCAT